jgi:hypothetical protein
MTDYIWPSSIVPNSSEWRLVSNTAAFASPLSGTTRTVGRGGDRWACSFTFNNLSDDNRAILQSFLAQLRGQTNRVYVRDHSYTKRGTFPTSNLVPPITQTTAWTTGFCTVAASDDTARLTASAHTAGQNPQIQYTTTITNGAAYAARAFFVRTSTGTASVGPALDDGSTLATSYSTSAGLKTTLLVAGSTTGNFYAVIDSTGTSTTAGDFVDVSYVSLARCALVSAGSQTGSTLTAYYTATTYGDLIAGDRIEVNGEFNMVTDVAGIAPGGAVQIQLARPLRTSPAALTPIIIHDPLCKMLLADQTVGWSNVPGGFSSFTVDFIEDIA